MVRTRLLASTVVGVFALCAGIACSSDDSDDAPSPSNTALTTVGAPSAGVPDVRIVPLVSSVGGTITVQGFNWPPGPVTLYIAPETARAQMEAGDGTGALVLGQAEATSSGSFTANVVVPEKATAEGGVGAAPITPGRYIVVARGATELRVSISTLTLR